MSYKISYEMSCLIRIMLPMFPSNPKDTVYFRGYISTEQHELVICICEFSKNQDAIIEHSFTKDSIYGYCSNSSHQLRKNKIYSRNCLLIEQSQSPIINKLVIDGKKISPSDNCLVMLYDSNKVRNSEIIGYAENYFSKLKALLHKESKSQNAMSYEPVLQSPYWLSSSMFAQHLLNYINLIMWLLNTIRRERKVSIRPGNLILAILTDLILGYLVLELLTQDKRELSSILMGVLEKLVNLLYSLLKWLMGAPAGLKLNNAFNKMLGKYFSYHIQLWWLFLDVSGEKLDTILHVYHHLGYLGVTFQAAMIADMICVATFHSYCIYVYAARLFNIQVSGLIALLRLFVGRKYNPLRGGIDSCEYTNQELFVGTVAFTILLLLLPTTTMYYIVFTLFRLLSLVVQYVLAKFIFLVQTLPLYVATLWLARSPKVAGNILIEMVNDKEDSPLVLKVNLFNKSLSELVNNFKPPVEPSKQFEWTNLLSNLFIGKQII